MTCTNLENSIAAAAETRAATRAEGLTDAHVANNAGTAPLDDQLLATDSENLPAAEAGLDMSPSLDLADLTADELGELTAACEARAATYALLARLYRVEVDADLLATLEATRFPVSTGEPLVDEGWRMIATYLSGAWENTLTELAVDYVHAFVGHNGSGYSAAYPFESVYRSERHLLMQDERDEVLALYRANGFEKDPSWREAEDHVALEFEFMQALTSKAVDALRAGDVDGAAGLLRTQGNFHADHIASWVPRFARDVEKFSKTGFYEGLARLTRGFVAAEVEFFADLA